MRKKGQAASSVTDVESFLHHIQQSAGMFRGQTRDWPLLPRIGRYPVAELGYEDWRTFHDDVIDVFLRLGRPHFGKYPETAAEAWVVAQHHGVPTRLLDTSTNPLKALYFAVSNPVDDVENGVVWAIEYGHYRTDLEKTQRDFWENELCAFLPAQFTPRLTAQEGAFLLCPLAQNSIPMVPVNKIKSQDLGFSKMVVPKKHKAGIRRELSLLGIKSRLLFPDLDGVARGIQQDLESGSPYS